MIIPIFQPKITYPKHFSHPCTYPLTFNTPLIHTSFTYQKLNMDEICGLKFYLLCVHTSQNFFIEIPPCANNVIFSTEFVLLDLNSHFYEVNQEV